MKFRSFKKSMKKNQKLLQKNLLKKKPLKKKMTKKMMMKTMKMTKMKKKLLIHQILYVKNVLKLLLVNHSITISTNVLKELPKNKKKKVTNINTIKKIVLKNSSILQHCVNDCVAPRLFNKLKQISIANPIIHTHTLTYSRIYLNF